MHLKKNTMTCTVCGYEYDPMVGDPMNGVPAGTHWENIPNNWLCPDCQMPKEDFEKSILS